MSRSRSDLWICAAILAATVAVYFQARTFDFVNYDDPDYVTANSHVREGLTPDGLAWAFTSGDAANWFPVTRISHMLDVQMFGLDGGAQHVTSVLIHAMAALMLFAFLRLATGDRWPSAFVAMIFALHPLHVESVAWISERKDVLCAFFWFLALWLWVSYVRQPARSRYLLALGAFALGLMSKPMIVSLPFLLLVLDFWPLRRGLRIREKLPFFALSAASVVITVLVQKQSGAVESLVAVPFAMRIENGLVSYMKYLSNTVWPSGLAVFYPYPLDIPASELLLAVVVLLAVSAGVWMLARKHPYLLTGWLWFVGTLIPVIGLVQVGSQARADRYMYVPMVGLAIMAAWGAMHVVRERRILAVAALLVCAWCVPLTWAQSSYWQNSESLYRHTLAVTRDNTLAEHNLGSALLDQPGKLPEALEHLSAARRLNPDSASIRSDLATALAKSGRLTEAIPEFQAAVRLNPNSAIVHNNLASALQQTGQVQEAVAEYNTALRLDPNYAEARKNLAIAQQVPPADSAEAHYSKGVDLSHTGRMDEAIAEFQAAIRLRPQYAEAENNLGVTLTQIPSRASEALAHFQAAVRFNPQYADAQFNLGVALSQIPGRMSEAVAHLEIAYRLHPDPELKQTLERLHSGR